MPFVHLHLEAPKLLGVSQTLPWYPPLQLRAIPTALSRHRPSRLQTPGSFPFLAEWFEDVPLSLPRPFEPIGASVSVGSATHLLATAFTLEEPWISRPGVALLPVSQGPFGEVPSGSPSPDNQLEKQTQTFDGVSLSPERVDTSLPIAPDSMRDADPL
jgi:hypothetical protein